MQKRNHHTFRCEQDLSMLSTLEFFNFAINKIASLNVINSPSLEDFTCFNNNLTTLGREKKSEVA